MKSFLPCALAALALCACGDDDALPGDPDAHVVGPTPDAGPPPDGNVPDDAHVPPSDAGLDAGMPDGGPTCAQRDPGVPTDPLAGSWDLGFANPGVGGDLPGVEAIAFDADGTVYVGGEFSSVGYLAASNVAAWDGGAGWSALGDGLSGRVGSLAVAPDGSVYAAYAPDMGWEPTRIARWDGTSWTTVGDADDAIQDLAVLGSTLFAVGAFTEIGGVAANGLARLEAGAWAGYAGFEPVVDGRFGGDPYPGTVQAISGTAPDAFCVGGEFDTVGLVEATGVACLESGAWVARSLPLIANDTARIAELERDPADGSLVAVGEFMFEDPARRGEHDASSGGSVARWVGDHWEMIGGGVMAGFGPGSTQPVTGVGFAPSGMYVGGGFSSVNPADEIPVNAVARFDGTRYYDIGGLFAEVGFGLSRDNVKVVAVGPDGSVYFGGLFTRADSLRVGRVVRYDGTYWSALRTPGERYEGISGSVTAMERHGACAVYLGGTFEYAGEVHANNVARYTREGGYEALGGGVVGSVADVAVFEDERVVIGGDFVDESGTVFRHLALWDGAAWTEIGGSVDGPLWAVAIDEADSPDGVDRIYAGGEFANAGSVPARSVAVWNGEEWSEVGGGLHGFPNPRDPTTPFEAYPYDLLVDPESGDLIVAGRFERVGDSELVVNNIARWDGTEWHAYGEGLGDASDGVLAVALWNGRLVAAGSFESSGETVLGMIAVWNGTAWEPVGASDALDGYSVTSVEAVGTSLFAAGVFEIAGTGVHHVAAFDGTAWRALGEGLSDLAEEVVAMDEGVYVGGTFDRAGRSASVGLALWAFE